MEYTNIQVSADSDSEEIAPIAMAVHELLGLPVAMRSLNKKGVLIEKGEIIDSDYTGPILERVLKKNKTLRTIPTKGRYNGVPVIVTPIKNKEGYCIAALGVVDLVGTIDLGNVFSDYPDILHSVQECLNSKICNIAI